MRYDRLAMHVYAKHVETVRSLRHTNEKEPPQLRRHESHSSSAQRLGAAIAQQRPVLAATAATAASAATESQGIESGSCCGEVATMSKPHKQSTAPDLGELTDRMARQWRSRCNRDIEARQERAIQKVMERRTVECARQEQEALKRQWRVHRAKSYLLSSIRDPELKGHIERTSKPRMLPKLPHPIPLSTSAKQTRTAASEDLGASTTASRSDVSPTELSPSQSSKSTSREITACLDVVEGQVEVDVSGGQAEEKKADASAELPEAVPEDGVMRAPLPHEGLSGSADDEGAEADNPEQSEEAGQTEQVDQAEASKQIDGQARQRGSVESFLDRQRIGLAARPCHTMAEWKRHNHCGPDQKVFACCGGYPDFREALLKRGWFHNPNKDSNHFDIKWGMVSNIHHDHLQPHQIVNHFDKCRDLTTKVGLTLALRSSVQLNDKSLDSYYPRAFDLYDPLDRADFVLDYKLTKAESIIRRFLEHVDSNAETTFSQDVVHVASKVCLRVVTDIDEVVDCEELAEVIGTVPSSDWKLLEKANLDNVLDGVSERLYTKAELEELIHKKFSTSAKTSAAARAAEKEKEKEKDKKKATKKKKKKKEEETEVVHISAPMETYNCPRGQHYIRQARSVLEEMEKSNDQHSINGSRNAWIVKPSGKSRGRGIQMLRELEEIFRVTESDGFQWICQKYIEQPQLIHGYKFDIRQWVLVTDWNPLTFYIWKQPYIRFAGQKYDSSCEDRNAYMHLVNNSILKYMDGFEKINEELNTSGYMWFRQQYEGWLHDSYCKCERHNTSWLTPPPYTCDTFGVRWEDVKFVAKDESDEEDEDNEPPDFGLGVAASAPADARQPGPPPKICQQGEAPQETVCGICTAEGDDDKASATHGTGNDVERGGEGVPECDNIWMTCVKPQIEEIVLTSLRCVSDSVQHRKNTYELFGYDFMLSEPSLGADPKVWLIEVNSSPACDYSTPVTCPLVKQMMEDTAKIMVDMRENPDTPTGEWEFIHHNHNKQIPSKKTCPIDLQVCGHRIKKPKGWNKKKKRTKKMATSADAKNHEQDEERDGEEEGGDSEGEDEGDDDSVRGGPESESDS